MSAAPDLSPWDPDDPMSALYTTKSVAAIFDCSVETVRDWAHGGKVPYRKMPDGSIRIEKRHLIALVQVKLEGKR